MEDRIMENEQYEIGNPAGKHTCIFCGSNLTILESGWTDFDWAMRPIDKDRTTFQVMCNDCGMAGPVGDTEEEAIDLYYNQPYGIPKLYSVEEVVNHGGVLFCWVEERNGSESFGFAYPAQMIEHPAFDFAFTNANFTPSKNLLDFKAVGGIYPKEMYNKTWRCWTAHPSDVCRVQTKWDI